MPPTRQRARRSARLRADARVHSMDPSALSVPPSEGQSKVPSESGPRLTIQWHNETALTDVLVNYLTSHPADCRVLFYSEGKKAMSPVNDSPSGSDKGQICSVIAKLIFTNHPKYGHAYHDNQKKFRDAINNRINSLRTKYKKMKARFGDTGASVMPLDGTAAKNLLDSVLSEFPWYTDLDGIWHSNPSLAAKTYSSKPGVDHAGSFYSLVQPRGGAGPSTSFGASPSPTHFSATPSASAHNVSPHTQARTSDPQTQAHTSDPQTQARTSDPQTQARTSDPQTQARTSDPLFYSDPPIDPQLLQPQTLAPPFTPPQTHLPGLRNSPDVTILDDYAPDSGSGPLNAPLGNALDYLDDNDEEMLDDTGAGSPPQVAGTKRHFAASPSPPPDAPQLFAIRTKLPTPLYDSRSAFGAHKPSSHGARRKGPSDMARSMSTPSSTTRNTTPSSDYVISPTPQTSLPNSGGSSKKKARSDVQDQVGLVRDEIESLQSSALSRHESKHQRYLAKLGAKSEHSRDTKKYEWLRDTRAHEASQASLVHQRQQEDKDAEIRLRETDIRVHEAHSLMLDKEAETLRLKIQYHQMMQGNKAPGLD
ncbi:uncharacterized protein HD556DRAFT_1437304 [Suillus plorans]|uniref:Uncharacterized protein n=1 Tax=Suillus plorans TaxID=116603 RepID=A0A9P7J5C8_9AGAM|nr:uncharacterized protein HD556DRAFT_1437304 [Suillus plorans]KAG1803544.1 hypothetical protein HD556DRAFT_1437304 [Suillus plorans]